MRFAVLVGSLLLAAPVLAGPGPAATGPFAGVVDAGDTDVHHYDNNPTNQNCIQIVRPYSVTVEATEAVRVAVAGHTFVADPVGSVTFQHGVCTQFDIEVVGVGDGAAAYAIEVTYGVPGVVCCLS